MQSQPLDVKQATQSTVSAARRNIHVEDGHQKICQCVANSWTVTSLTVAANFGYHVPAKHVVNCRGSKNWMTIYGNTTVCEAPAKAPSRPNVIARPRPTWPISRNGSSPDASGHGPAERRAKERSFRYQLYLGGRVNLQALPNYKNWRTRRVQRSHGLARSKIQGNKNVDICCVEGFPKPKLD